jgi:16S rRNA (uracil1498-N3)-methyltransferase
MERVSPETLFFASPGKLTLYMHLFYAPNAREGIFDLPDEESHHLFHVLRLRVGESVEVTDGSGGLYACEVHRVGKQGVQLQTLSSSFVPPPARKLHIGVAATKNADRLEWFTEKAVEMGVQRITPLLCQRSERKQVNTERLQKIIVAAAKQSRHFYFPSLDPMTSLDAFVSMPHSSPLYIAYCSEGSRRPLGELCTLPTATVLIGPEGDFSKEEIDAFLSVGALGLSLGDARLRTETAALKAVAAFNL